MMWIVLAWTVMSVAATYTAGRAAWRAWRWRRSGGIRYMISMLIGAALFNGYAAAIGLVALPGTSGPLTLGAALFTLAHAVEIVPLVLFTFYLTGIFRSGPDRELL